MWNSSDQHFTKTYVDKTSVSFVALPVFWHEKSFQKPLENNCDGVIFQWSCRLWGNLRKGFMIVSFGWFLCEMFQINFFLKQLGVNASERLYEILPVFWKKSHRFWHLPFELHSNSWCPRIMRWDICRFQ